MTAPPTLPGGYRAESPAQVRLPAGPQPTDYGSFDGSLTARYTADSGGVLVIGGAWGTITDPGAAMTVAIAAMESPHGRWTVPPADVEARDPNDPQGRLTCGVWTEALLVNAICLWADHYTAGSVDFPAWAEGSPAVLNPATAADRARRIRDAMTAPK
ncbi:hypothetical protein [Kitasatospora sp. NPDC059599]|uniref:hypothetical protein n=1 Tax=Kitasatospora sp. NPDC059599 TaxID=3346880 RepID=UPI00367B0900